MFNFMKKSSVEKDEKEKRKKEKEGKKKRERVGMTAEELLRIDEMRRSLKIRSRRKEKEKLPSGITADYSENFFADLERDPEFKSGSLPGHTKAKNSPSLNRGEVSTQSDSSEASLNSLHTQGTQKVLPPLPPRPPKRGILKGSKSSVNSTEYYENHDPNSTSLLVRNTLQNEVITYQNIPPKNTNGVAGGPRMQSSPEHAQLRNSYLSVNDKNNLLSVMSSPSAESLTDTTNSSFATPPYSLSPTGESQGFARTHSSVDDKSLDLPLPSIMAIQLPKPRELTIHRTAKGDFGFQLRRAIITDKLSSVNKKTVIFAEPGAIIGNRNETGLLPGDILLEVNGIQVHDKSREEIIDLIKSSGASVAVKVQPIPELCELTRRSGLDGSYVVLGDSNIRGGTLKRSGSLRFKKATAKTEEELTSERALLDAEKLWLVHKGGFTAVRALPAPNQQPDGKVKVKVESTGEVLEVEDDDLEKANPAQLDKIEDICQLRYINESSVLYILRQRFGNNLIHTYAAGNLVVINPQCTLSIYNEKVAALFRGCKSEDMPPHIYAMAQTTHRSMLSSRKDQSIVLLGRSGSGKTHNFRHILSYLLHSAGAVNKVLTLEKLNSLNTILEAFGNARTCLNVNATRCTNLISLDFDQTGQIASLSVQMLMLEKQRVGRRPDGEGTFNVFYWLLAGAEGSLAKQLFLDSTTHTTNLFITALYKNEDRQRAVMELSKLSLALKALGVTEKESFVLWSVIAAIYHLGNAGTVRVGTNKWQFADPVHSSRACRLLGTTTEELGQTLWNSPTSPSRTPSPTDKDKTVCGSEALEGFVIGLYSELVNVINNLLNRSLTTNVHSTMSLVVVDSPGVQNPGSCGQQRGASFSDLCHNYVQERLHQLFHNINLVAPHDRYTQEHIDLNTEEIYSEFNSPNQLVSILDKSPPSGVLKTSQTDLREIDRRGLLWLLDEESLYPNSSDETFLERLFQHYGGKDHQLYIRKSSGVGHFVIHHFQGTNPVTYTAHGLLKASKENPLTRSAVSFLQESTKEDISEVFVKGKGGLLTAGAEGSQSLRRVSSIRRTCSVAVKKKSISLQIKFTADSLIETLRRTRPRFVFCMLPHHNAGNTEIIPGPATGENALNVPLLRSQVRGAEILPAVRMFKQGFPEYFPHGEFRRRFRLLAPGSGSASEPSNPPGVQITINGQSPEALDEARAVEEMLLQMDVDITSYRIGLSQIFFRAGILAQLESQRDEKLADLVIQLQSRCRGYLARKKLAKLKVQDIAVRCIQRNVRKLMQVREWPWWRLYVKVTPLLNVHRTEEELVAKTQELEALKSTLDKLEQERNQLKLENDKLETKSHEAKEKLGRRRTRKMERSLGFFDAWRAKKREKKDEEVSIANRLASRTVENGVLSKYLTMGNQKATMAGADETSSQKDEKSNESRLVNGTATDDAVQPAPSSKNPTEEGKKDTEKILPMHVTREQPRVPTDTKGGGKIMEKSEAEAQPSGVSEVGKDAIADTSAPVQPKPTPPKVRRKSSVIKSPPDSRRSSCSVQPDAGSRRSSLAISSLNSFSNIQEKFQALSREHSQSDSTSKKVVKINKLNEDVLKIGKVSEPKPREPAKIFPKVDSDLRSKITKFGAGSGGAITNKPTGENETKVGKSSEINNGKATTVGVKSSSGVKDSTAAEIESKKPVATEVNVGSPNCSEIIRDDKTPGGEDIKKENATKFEKKEQSTNVEKKEQSTNVEKKEQSTNGGVKSENVTRMEEEKTSGSQCKTETKVTAPAIDEVKKATQENSTKGGDNASKQSTELPGDKARDKVETKVVLEKDKKPLEDRSSSAAEPKASKPASAEKKAVAKVLGKKSTASKPVQDGKTKKLKNDSHRDLIKEAMKVRETMTVLTDRANQLVEENSQIVEKSKEEDKSQSDSASESVSLRKDQGKLLKKLKVKSSPDESYPKTQKLLTGKPINAFEQAKLEESKREAVVSPTKVEAFLRETLSPPVVRGGKEPVKTMEAVVEEILTSTSEKSKFEKPSLAPTPLMYSSRGEVILGSVSIKPSAKVEENPDTLSAITLVPAFRPENSILDCKEERNGRIFDFFSDDAKKPGAEKLAGIAEDTADQAGGSTKEPGRSRERSPFSPVSDFSDDSYDHYVASVDYSLASSSYEFPSRRSLRSTSTPRRIFPQVAIPSSYRSRRPKEDSPVVFDAGLSFDLSSNRSSLRHHFKPQPAFTDRMTSSNSLSLRIADFLKRTDHIMDEWKHLGKGGGDDLHSLVELPSKKILGHPSSKYKSATNIMIKGLLNYSKGSRESSMRSRSVLRTSENSDRTISDIDELSEMTLDLSEERAASTAQAERLEAETAERVKLEQELSQVQFEKKNLQQTSERLEMELFYARADVNGLSESEADLEDGGGDASLYKNKCERAMRELEFTRRRLQQQHEDDLEQLVGLKKQLEKKLTDAYEEVEEQRQVAGQWKRKVQKLQSEMNDIRLLLEEQSSRNNLLEKKQRKFDSEIQLLQEELRSEKNQKDRSSREKEMAYAEKYSMEQNLSSVRLELELKEEKVAALARELEELTRGGGTEQEVTQLRKSKHDLELKLKEQEEELDELAGQVSMLEGNKLRLEMSLESLRKEHRREMAQRDDELDEARSNAHKKIKVLESQLESEHEERTLLVREKHELERRLADAEERGRHYRAADEDALQRARRDLKKTKALLRDAQVMLERAKQDSPSKAALRALKNQLEDAELARASAVKARQSLESELSEVSGQLEEVVRAKGDAENRCQAALRETNALRTQVEENEEELAELLKKYRQTVQQLSAEQLANQETAGALAEAEAERASLRDQLAELSAKLEANSLVDPISGIAQKKLEIRIKELESRLELEQTTRGRLEVQIARLKENVERLNEECVQARTKEQAATDLTRKLQRSLREAKEELALQQTKEQEAVHKRKELEKRLETAEQETTIARTDLRLAVKRIEDLQSAISGEIGSDSERSESDEDDSGDDSIISHVPSSLSSTARTTRTPELTPR